MADQTPNSNVDSLRQEITQLRGQLESIIKNIESKKSETSNEVIEKLTKLLDNARATANDEARKLYDAGNAGVTEICEHVRKKPICSLALAFGAGCIMACIIKHLTR